MQLSDPALQPEAVTAFLATAPPFDRLGPAALAELATAGRVAFYLNGEVIAEATATEPFVCCIQRGGVVMVRPTGEPGSEPGEARLQDALGEGECFGVAGALPGCPAGCRILAAADTFLVRLPGVAFAAIAARNPAVTAFFDACLTQSRCVLPEGTEADPADRPDGDYLFTRLAGEVASRGIVAVARGTDLRGTARIMEEAAVGSVLVREGSGSVIGIVTDRDLRRAVAQGLGLGAPVETLMSAPVAALDAATSCFEALSRMTEAGIRHLLVTGDGEPVGMVTANDLLLAHGRSPMALMRAIRRAGDAVDLAALCRRTGPLAAALAARGATAATVGGLLTMTAQAVLARLLELLVRRFGPPPARWCLLALGAAGRRELLPGLGLDLVVVADDGDDDIIGRAMETYCHTVLPVLAGHLADFGLGGAHLAGPVFLSGLTAFLRTGPEFAHLEARMVAGDSGLGEGVRARLLHSRPDRDALRACLAAQLLNPAPLGIHQGKLVERDGSFAAVFDIAARGTQPIVTMARLAGLLAGIQENGTANRLAALGRLERLPPEVARNAEDAFAFFQRERLMARLSGLTGDPDVVARPSALSARRRQEYRAAFGAVEALRQALGTGLGAGEGAP
ncbi:CBS domain-containing protein [Desulfovibrio aerotolerans]|uniref:CBS domain-containing protein n=1 Tax=Solidesulfovibrio aerotolerans TaxID=295255 RepID=A0A7C9MZ57_9BACT|nr:putative nucleotidyltransferase substrate binding domain-containing protein [Solidesulfovibrio aerotolerans]MYL82117.1 CBS domain-containing protein [Solidesulfovibrio aerotolerans]